MNLSEYSIQMLQIIQTTPLASVSPLLRNSILRCSLGSSFWLKFNNRYVEVASKIEDLVFIHSTLSCVICTGLICVYRSCNRTQHIICTKLEECRICLGSSLIRVMGNWICTYGLVVTRAFTVLFSGTFLVKL